MALITIYSFLLDTVPPLSSVTYSEQFCLFCFAANFQIAVIRSTLHDYFSLEYLHRMIHVLYN